MRIFALFLFLINTAQISFGQNVIQNGSFEKDLSNWIVINGDLGASVAIDSGIVFKGEKSLRVEISNFDSSIISGVFQSIPIKPNTSYYFSHAVKTEQVDNIVFPFMKFNAGSDVFVQRGYLAGFTQDWKTYDMRFTTPDQVSTVEIFIFLVGNQGKAWLDSLVLKEIDTTTDLAFSVDLNQPTSTFNNLLLGTNSSPKRPNSSNDFSNFFEEIGIQEVRTHDIFNSCDINVVFPDFSADPLDSNAYDFTATDEVIQSIIDVNAKPFFRLGYSFSLQPVYNVPPADFEKWATICGQIVKHYNQGWNNGFFYDIKKWEIWNEPDLVEFWTGTPQQFYDLYFRTTTKIKAIDSSLEIGAAGFNLFNNTRFLQPFFDSISFNNVPIDFISFHSYTYTNPYYYNLQLLDLTDYLTEFNLAQTDIYLTEWNTYAFGPQNTITEFGRDDALNAALTASSYYYMNKSNLTGTHRYRTDDFFFGLFRDNGTYSYSGLAIRAVASLKDYEIFSTEGNDTLGLSCLAGKSSEDETIRMLVSNPNQPSNTYTLELKNLSQSFNYQITRIDSSHEFVEVQSGVVSATNNTITANVSPPYIDLITLSGPTGLEDNLLQKDHISLFPNPTNAILTIKTNRNYAQAEITIYSLIGQKKRSVKNSLQISLQGLSSGVYLLEVVLDEQAKTFKVIKTD